MPFLEHFNKHYGETWEMPGMFGSDDEHTCRLADDDAQRAAWVAVGPLLTQLSRHNHLPLATIVPESWAEAAPDCQNKHRNLKDFIAELYNGA